MQNNTQNINNGDNGNNGDNAKNSGATIFTFGCRLNIAESESIRIALNQSQSDVNNLAVFNSCAVTANAEKELITKIKQYKKKNPNIQIVVTGCAAQINPQKYAKMPEVSAVIGNQEKTTSSAFDFILSNRSQSKQKSEQKLLQQKSLIIANADSRILAEEKNGNHSQNNLHQDINFTKNHHRELLNSNEEAKILVNDIMSVRDTAPQLVSYFDNKTRAFLEIQNGCNHRCTFCIIPYGRGNSRSVAFGEIIDRAEKMILAGHNEIVLTGVDITDYGKDLPSPLNLTQMLRRMLKLLPQLKRLRLSSVDVAELGEDFCSLLAEEPRLMPYLHLSVQSGDDLILKRMARRHNRKQIVDFCNLAKKARPEIAFGADIIAGFPTEDDLAFNNSLSLIGEIPLVYGHIFPYSPRSGTPAAKMPQLPKDTIKERASLMRLEVAKNLDIFLAKQMGSRLEILVEQGKITQNNKVSEGKIIGRATNFATVVVDSIQEESKDKFETLPEKDLPEKDLRGKDLSGKFIEVEIYNYKSGKLFGKIIN
jgi:threonylcarbamoyladenosine tRNA methylthiotransferase MtaB